MIIRTCCSYKKEENLDGPLVSNEESPSFVCTDNNIPKISPEKAPVVMNVVKLLDVDEEENSRCGKRFSGQYFFSIYNILGGKDDFDGVYVYSSIDYLPGDKDYAVHLMDTYHSLVQLDVLHLSGHELNYSFRNILRQIKEILALLDRECIDYDIVLKETLDSSKVLNRKVSKIEFYIDMLKNLKRLLISNVVFDSERVVLNNISELDIVLLYSRLKAVIGSDKIRDELLFSPNLNLSLHPLAKRK